MQRRADIGDVKAALQARALELARFLCPGGDVVAGIYKPCNPTRADRNPGSFCIWLKGAVGAWTDYATGEKGDILDLVAYVNRTDRKAAFQWALAWTGLGGGARPPPPPRRMPVRTAAAPAEGERRARRLKGAQALWLGGLPLADTVADLYFYNRGLPLDRLPHAPRALRFVPSLEHPLGAVWHDGRKVADGPRYPAIVAAMTTFAGGFAACHRTYLEIDGSGKAPVASPRLIAPDGYAGAAIRLWRGKGNLSPRQALDRPERRVPLVIIEGIEKGLAVVLADPDLRVWVAGTVGNMGNLVVAEGERRIADEVILFRDNDLANRQASAQLERAAERYDRQGVRVRIARSPVGKDADDLIRWRPAIATEATEEAGA